MDIISLLTSPEYQRMLGMFSRQSPPSVAVKTLEIGTWLKSTPTSFAVEWDYQYDMNGAKLVIDRGRKTIEVCIRRQQSIPEEIRLSINFSCVKSIKIGHEEGSTPCVFI